MHTGPGTPARATANASSTAGPRSRTRRILVNSLTCGSIRGRWSMSCKRAAALQRGGRGAAEQNDRRLRELRVLERGDGVREPGARRHRGDAGHAGQACHRIGGEHRSRLVAHVDDAHAARLGRGEYGRDMAAAQGEHKAHALGRQRRSDAVAAVHGDRFHFHLVFLLAVQLRDVLLHQHLIVDLAYARLRQLGAELDSPRA